MPRQRHADISGQSDARFTSNLLSVNDLGARAQIGTGYVILSRPNCLIPKPLTLTSHAGRFGPV